MKEAVLRTLVPIVYALLLKAGIGEWLAIDSAVLESAAALVAAALVYVVLRAAERWRPRLGWLLGYPAQPVYAPVTPDGAHIITNAEAKVDPKLPGREIDLSDPGRRR